MFHLQLRARLFAWCVGLVLCCAQAANAAEPGYVTARTTA